MSVFVFITRGMKTNSTSISVTVLQMGVERALRISYIINFLQKQHNYGTKI
jgi:hypothetical protein